MERARPRVAGVGGERPMSSLPRAPCGRRVCIKYSGHKTECPSTWGEGRKGHVVGSWRKGGLFGFLGKEVNDDWSIQMIEYCSESDSFAMHAPLLKEERAGARAWKDSVWGQAAPRRWPEPV